MKAVLSNQRILTPYVWRSITVGICITLSLTSLRRLNSWVVSHLALIIGALCPGLWVWSLVMTNSFSHVQHLCFLNDSIWFIRFDTIICVSNLLCELWNRKLNMKEIYFFKKVWLVWVNEICWYIKIIFLADSYPVKHGVSHTVPPNVSEYSLVELINRVGHWLWLSW